MSQNWNELQGVCLAGRYWLNQCLNSAATEAWYLTRLDGTDAAVRIVRADAPLAEQRLGDWREVRRIEQPHIARMFDAGRAELGGVEVIYTVCEYPDDFLSTAVAERALSAAEAGEVLESCLAALEFLHSSGFVHGAVTADRVVAMGEKIKLLPDTIRRGGVRRAFLGVDAYAAPELAAGGAYTAAADMWSLGVLLVELLTRTRPVAGVYAGGLPEPFATIASQTLRQDPASRWSAAEVEAYLHAPAAAAQPAPEVAALAEVPPPAVAEPEKPAAVEPRRTRVHSATPASGLSRHGQAMKWVPLAGVIAAVGLGVVFLPHATPPPAKPAVQTVSAPGRLPASESPVAHPVAAPPAHESQAPSDGPAIWRVVVYEYSNRAAAEQEARILNRKRPWHAEVFEPRGKGGPFLVSLGGRMTLPEAERLRKQAWSSGLPRDTFVRNFAK